jgi:outer membrane assembly lipoprotein YfiO
MRLASRLIPVLAVLAVLLAGCATGGHRPLAPAAGPDQLRVAKLRYDEHQYADAIELLKGYLQFQTGAPDLDEAHFLLGMSYYKREEWPLAGTEFQLLITDFADSPRLGDAHYWLGMAYWKQSRPAPYDQDMTRRAMAQFDRFLTLFPDHPQAHEIKQLRLTARDRLAEKANRNGRLYLKLHYWDPARYYFALVRSDYPETRWAERSLAGQAAALMGLRRMEEARALLEAGLPTLTDPEARHAADEVLKKLGRPLPAGTNPPAPAAGAQGAKAR